MNTPTPAAAPQEPPLTGLSHVRELAGMGMVTGASGRHWAADGIQLRVN